MTYNSFRLDWLPDIAQRDTNAYVALADALEHDIKKGRLKAGQKLPPQRLLAYALDLNPGTVHKAYQLATKRGLIVGEIGRGSFVRGLGNRNSIWPNENPYDRAVDFCDNFPCQDTSVSAIKKQLIALSNADNLVSLLQYQQNSAWAGHYSSAIAWLAGRGIAATSQEILITSGAVHAGFISMLTLCRAGDTVLTEELTSPAVKEAASRLGLRLKGIPMDQNGIIPARLKELLLKEKVTAVYLTPTLHNPTATLLPLSRRHEVADILTAFNIPLIEDDVFGPLLDEPLTPIASLIPDLGFYIAGLSKALSPALRIAFLKTPLRYYQESMTSLRSTTWLASPLLMEIAGNLIMQGDALKMIREQKAKIKTRQAMAKKILAEYDIFGRPEALHLWLKLPEPWRAVQFRDILRAKEVLVQSTDSFAVDRNNPIHAIRICLGTPPNSSKVMEGLQIIRDTLDRGA